MALDLTPNNRGLPHYECIILSRSILLGFGLWAPLSGPVSPLLLLTSKGSATRFWPFAHFLG